jgi:hypothetical protein
MTCPPHRFVVEKPDGSPELVGGCKKCGHRRTWPASLDEHGVYALKRRTGTANSRRKA